MTQDGIILDWLDFCDFLKSGVYISENWKLLYVHDIILRVKIVILCHFFMLAYETNVLLNALQNHHLPLVL